MHPNVFLKSLWRNEIKSQVFVAMDFSAKFGQRFDTIIRPAIEAEPIEGENLKAFRVDNSATGDSILSEIVNGIAHSRLVLADVSVVDEGRFTEKPIRNSNVMYEVGVALACRSSSDVLLVRDDTKNFLFDVSTIPHLHIDFSNPAAAIAVLRKLLTDRLRESDFIHDARVIMAVRSLSNNEYQVLKFLADLPPGRAYDFVDQLTGLCNMPDENGIDRLLDKGCLQSVGLTPGTENVAYTITQFGRIVFNAINQHFLNLRPRPKTQ